MSVRVNLLPSEAADANRAARMRLAVGGAGLGLVAILALVYVFQSGRVSDAREVLASEQRTIDELQAEVAELAEFGQLAAERDAADADIAANFAGEVSFAGILQDLATVYPSGAELDQLSVAVAQADPATPGIAPSPLGRMTASGATLRGHAPGLERLLLELDKVAAFTNVFFSNSTQDEAGVATFSLDLDLGTEILTQRYVDGLPEELR